MALRKLTAVLLVLLTATLGAFASGQTEGATTVGDAIAADEAAMAAETRPDFSSPQFEDPSMQVDSIPEEVTWYTSEPGIFGSSRAKQGGTFRTYVPEFPQTFRTVGPNSNTAFRGYLLTSPGLVEINSETKEWMPALATHWAFGEDGKTAYYRLNPNARWNDGEPITSEDYLFLLEMMRSENIQAPWYNDYYTNQVVDIRAYDDYTISVHANVEKAPDDLIYSTSVSPRPAHHYNGEITETWVDDYQWVYEPTAGPYAMGDYQKGEYITFEKVEDWWGYEYDYNQYRFNIQTIEVRVITGGRDIVKNYFFNGELDNYALIIPQDWADSESVENIAKGYIDRQYAFYVPLQGVYGIMLNVQAPVFEDRNVRYGLYYAINIDKMIDTVLRGEYARYHNIGLGHVFAGIQFDDNTIRVPDFDPEKAAEYFEMGGFTEIGADGIRVNDAGERLSFELLYSAPHHTERLSVLKEEAKKAGLEIELNLMQEGMFTTILEKQHEAWWGGMSTSLYPSYWQYFHSSNAFDPQTNNFFGYASDEMDRLVDAARDTGDLEEKAELTKQIQQLVHEDALVVPSYYVPYWRGAAWKWIRFPGWLTQRYHDDFYDPITGTSGYVGYMWIDEDIRDEVMQAMKDGVTFEPRTFIDDTNKIE